MAEKRKSPEKEMEQSGLKKPKAGPSGQGKKKNEPISQATLEVLVKKVAEQYDDLFGKLGGISDPVANSAARKHAWKLLAAEVNA